MSLRSIGQSLWWARENNTPGTSSLVPKQLVMAILNSCNVGASVRKCRMGTSMFENVIVHLGMKKRLARGGTLSAEIGFVRNNTHGMNAVIAPQQKVIMLRY
jgi:hypothetical protein